MSDAQSATRGAVSGGVTGGAPASAPALALEAVTKRFGPVIANDAVSFHVGRGEIVALVGENGAGKSTVVNLVSGVFRPDEGRILIGGEPANIGSPAEAFALGIGVVHQHYTLIPTLTALENIALSMPELGRGVFARAGLRDRVDRIADELGFRIGHDERVDRLDVAHQQRIEIVKALLRDVRLLLLDEPTAVLGPEDRRRFFGMVQRLRERGVAVILITHKLEDVYSTCDRAVVMRGGRVVMDRATDQLGKADLIEAMIGSRDPGLAGEPGPDAGTAPSGTAGGDTPIARVDRITLHRRDGSAAVENLSFDIRRGEILAIAGVDGNGQSELMACLAGMQQPAAGAISLFGLYSGSARDWNPWRLRGAGVAHIPEDRRRTGIVEAMDLARNHLLCHAGDPGLVSRGVIRFARLDGAVARLVEEFGVKATGPRDRMGSLSGGNQQKLVLARELAASPGLLLASHPSRGLDVRTTRLVHLRLREVADRGAAVVLVSGDLDEIAHLGDRVLVLSAGRGFGPVDRAEATRERLGAWIAGHEAA